MYGKIYSSLWNGSLVGRSGAQLVLVYLVANCDQVGTADFHPQAIANATGLPLDQVRAALAELEAPDPESRTPDEDGARITRLDDHRDWGWSIVNYPKYRTQVDPETVREQTRARVRRHRSVKRSVTVGNAPKRQAEAEAEAEAKSQNTSPRKKRSAGLDDHADFVEWYYAYPKHVARIAASKSYTKARNVATREQLLDGARAYAADPRRDPEKTKHPATWLNGGCWTDEAPPPGTTPRITGQAAVDAFVKGTP